MQGQSRPLRGLDGHCAMACGTWGSQSRSEGRCRYWYCLIPFGLGHRLQWNQHVGVRFGDSSRKGLILCGRPGLLEPLRWQEILRMLTDSREGHPGYILGGEE
jgi:hypothetical protein